MSRPSPRRGDIANFTSANETTGDVPNDVPTPPRRGQSISNDPTTIEKVRHIVRTQFDYEILLKRHELRAIRRQITRGEELLHQLHHIIINGPSAPPSRQASPHQTSVHTRSSGRPTRTPSTQNKLLTQVSDVLYSRRDDGAYVRLTCPVCGRWEFANMQGFLNHCRIKHQIEFPSHSEAARSCGTVVDEGEVPAGHAARRMPVKPVVFDKPTNFVWGISASLGSQDEGEGESAASTTAPTGPEKQQPKINVYEEDIDMMDLEYSSPALSSSALVRDDTGLGGEVADEAACATRFIRTSPTAVPGRTLPWNAGLDASPRQCANEYPMTQSAKGDNEAVKDVVQVFTSPETGDRMWTDQPGDATTKGAIETVNTHSGMTDGYGSSVRSPVKLESDGISDTGKPSDNEEHEEEKPNTETPTPSGHGLYPSHLAVDAGSRFYVKRQVVLGNVSRFIPTEKREPGMEKYEFKWMVYLHGPTTNEDITPFVRKVRFYLHPDYRPYDVVEISEPPFRLTRYGWGEFPVRLQVYFVDERNKPVDFIHILKLDTSKSGRQVLGTERIIDLELDRNTEFAESRQNMVADNAMDTGTSDVTQPEKSPKSASPSAPATGHSESLAITAKAMNDLLESAVGQFPIIRPVASGTRPKLSLPYSTAPSISVYMSWPLGKRKASEWQRARLLLRHVQSQCDTYQGQKLTVRDVMHWCRDNGHNPTPQVRRKARSGSPPGPSHLRDVVTAIQYCRYCGVAGAHDGAFDDCKWRPRMWRSRVWSLSRADDLLRGLDASGERPVEEADMDIVIDSMRDPSDAMAHNGANTSMTRRWYSNHHPTASQQEIDWISRTVEQLRLPATFGQTETEKRIAYGLIFQVAKSFLRRLLENAIDVYRNEAVTSVSSEGDQEKTDTREHRSAPFTKILVPLHLYRALVDTEEFDFLTGAGLAR
ncbi:uncharacterized protein SPPG_01072 [Spizellomyces punctatus DAOM BR117]|uniref:YEATS domain-containing protein n=1 Tax=Spizellomyces punctatus (strain DAOM BR117) TaxID=645134 RepID=A0A0L0HR98_SPIPD|nr:uncharacterized protein SPPG_01072 [Spizellomyces punctatus DAOM BR117]KND03597.1 hypothetical protein SPPG_01072 [Spizellomyces punctatus DAOM BR117]|eukprot:XP_016611636.1 hypothetical protein SPPG_01072 [Spizellomyces punctatus DAOM BR117]